MPQTPPLIERKQRAARDRIVRAAGELFAERGFADVSVSDIAERAEVGRTTFFRHFGDKQEVVFAREQSLLEALTAEHLGEVDPGDRSARSAVAALQPLVLRLCAHVTEDPEDFARHERLVAASTELRGRSAAKAQLVAERLSALLVDGGWDEPTARFAGQIALACSATARASSGRPERLVDDTRAAFERALTLGADPT
ncbi:MULTISPECIES: TetR/AcrR family transcriptional regulator [unclassified Curtobacterium]|uniref:TetR/AcrR family transcriptional regulator n=1 Tax=unclassified Curtobacterium TaxID=257496 RepID=UPI0008DD2392|nr:MULTISPECIES: TetR/AcrR family transcriptional regulator [unclassified Curtobacterium]OIH99914.1 hypothetical protein BIU92_01400 [Curtobacterium sp. MCBA15_003]OII11828.1 hypothetical protein BIU97_06195 [Curtobacterium sp. MCBA15_009]OII30868.1 hypothetical protein BIU94_07495 [Curtobacterium sp. MMLR14_006]